MSTMKKYFAVTMVIALALCFTGCKSSDYNNAVKALNAGDYPQAIDLFSSLGDYKDSALNAEMARYSYGLDCMEREDYETAFSMFSELGEYQDSARKRINCLTHLALQKYEAGQVEEAIQDLASVQDNEFAQKALRKIQYEWFCGSGCIEEWEKISGFANSYVNSFKSKIFIAILGGGEFSIDYDDPDLVSMEKANTHILELLDEYDTLFPTGLINDDPIIIDFDKTFRAAADYGTSFFTRAEFVKWPMSLVGNGVSSNYSLEEFSKLLKDFQAAADNLKASVND